MTENHRLLDSYAHLVTLRTAPIELVRAAVSFGLLRGFDANEILKSSGISPALLSAGRSRVTEEQVTRVVRELWRSTDDEMFGLGPLPLPRGSFRMLCYGILSAPTLGTSLERLSGFAGAMRALPPIRLETTGDTARLTLVLPPVDDPDGLFSVIGLVIIHRVMSWAIGQPVPLTGVTLPGSGSFGAETYRMLFGTSVQVDSEMPTLEFPSRAVSTPIVRSEADIEAFVTASPAGLLSRPEYEATIADQVRRIFEQGLKSQDMPSAEAVARRLAISTQTLRRKLAEEDTSTRSIREELLRDAAVTSLVQGDESVAELSERLGFSEPSAFTRAFRRWTGSTPGSYKR